MMNRWIASGEILLHNDLNGAWKMSGNYIEQAMKMVSAYPTTDYEDKHKTENIWTWSGHGSWYEHGQGMPHGMNMVRACLKVWTWSGHASWYEHGQGMHKTEYEHGQGILQ